MLGNPFYCLGCSYSGKIFFWQQNQLLRPERDFEGALLDGDDDDNGDDDDDDEDGNDSSDDDKAVTRYFFPILRKRT